MGLVVIVALLLFLAALYGANCRDKGTCELRRELEAARVAPAVKTFQVSELESLPVCVQRYFRAVLTDVQPMIAAASFTHSGTFKMSETAELWQPFTSTQRAVAQRPGFDGDGCIERFPGIHVCVHDAYVSGEGQLQVLVF